MRVSQVIDPNPEVEDFRAPRPRPYPSSPSLHPLQTEFRADRTGLVWEGSATDPTKPALTALKP